jgi:hypothetical protein
MEENRRGLARGVVAGIVTPPLIIEGILFLPRSSFFWAWRPEKGGGHAPPPSDAADVFPVPGELLAWRSFPSPSPESPGRMWIGIARTTVRPYGQSLDAQGTVVTGVAPRICLRGAAVPGDAGVIIDACGDAVEIGVRDGAGVVFCKEADPGLSLADDVRNVIQFARSHGMASPLSRVVLLIDGSRATAGGDDLRVPLEKEGCAVTVIDSAALDNASAAARLFAERRFIPFATPRRPSAAGRLWQAHGKNILAAASLAFVVGSLLLNAAIDATRLETKKLSARQRLLRAETAVSPGSARRSGPDLAVPVLSAVMERLPPASYLIDYRYDAPHRSLHLSGRAADYEKVSQFAAALARQPAFHDVRGGPASLVQVDHRTAVDFAVEAAVR